MIECTFCTSIWVYLTKIAQEEDITVLITTHYIEETKDASKVSHIKLVLIISMKKLLRNVLQVLKRNYSLTLKKNLFCPMIQIRSW